MIMKRLYLMILGGFLCHLGWSQNCQRTMVSDWSLPACQGEPTVLIFEDNFDGTTLDLNKWALVCSGQGAAIGSVGTVGNLNLNRLENCEVSNGTLKITAREETVPGLRVNYHPPEMEMDDGLPNERIYEYTSSYIKTIDQFQYGKYEALCRLPTDAGVWPAFWTYVWESNWHEIDIFEVVNDMDRWTGALHHDYNEDGEKHISDGESCMMDAGPYDFGQWHKFTCYYLPDRIRWLVDDVEVAVRYRYRNPTTGLFPNLGGSAVTCATTDPPNNVAELKAFVDEPMAICLSMAVQNWGSYDGNNTGNNANAPFPSAVFPSVFEIDYVRYWGFSCQDCPQNMTYTNTSAIPPQTHTNVNVTGGSGAVVANGQSVDFRAGESVILEPGFAVQAGGEFLAQIEDCNNDQYQRYEYLDPTPTASCVTTTPQNPMIYVGTNLVNGTDLILCSNPQMLLEAYEVNSYSVRVTHQFTQSVYNYFGQATSNMLPIWDATGSSPGFYQVQVILGNCEHFDFYSYNVYVSLGSCKMGGGNEAGEATADFAGEAETAPGYLDLYPNPSSGRLFLRSSWLSPGEAFTYEVVDLSGRSLFTGRQTYSEGVQLRLPPAAQASGIYFVRIRGQAGTWYRKVLID